jgi:hypothetical protein
MSKASNDQLDSLHAAVANVLASALKQDYYDKEGNKVPPPAALIANAIKFLKDNGIEAQAVPGSPLASVADLPIFDESDPYRVQ